MTMHNQELVVGITPFEEPNAALAVALAHAGAVGVLNLGRDAGRARSALADVCRWWGGAFGVRVPAECPLRPIDLPEQVDLVVLGPSSLWPFASGRRTWVEVVSLAEARAAVRAGAYGLIAKGAEAGGRVGTTTTFVLLHNCWRTRDHASRCGRQAASGRTPRPRRSPAARPGW